MALTNVGTTTLDPAVTLIAADDQLTNEVMTLYFDVIVDTDSGWELTNQMFYESYDNLNEMPTDSRSSTRPMYLKKS